MTRDADPLPDRGAAQAAGVSPPTPPTRAARPPASVLGIALDATGPAGLGALLARLGDAAIVDSRVLLAHVVGADERLWPSLEDRLASDLLLPDRIADPWLRALTESAVAAPIPVLLGGHSLVGPGLRLLFPSRDGRASGASGSPATTRTRASAQSRRDGRTA